MKIGDMVLVVHPIHPYVGEITDIIYRQDMASPIAVAIAVWVKDEYSKTLVDIENIITEPPFDE
jgi:hypothetical protein